MDSCKYESLRPYGNRVLVRRLGLPDTVESGLYLLGRDYPTMGTILAVGNGQRSRKIFAHAHKRPDLGFGPRGVMDLQYRYRRPLDLKVGSIVQWRVGPNFDLYDLGNDLLLLPYSELNFVLEG